MKLRLIVLISFFYAATLNANTTVEDLVASSLGAKSLKSYISLEAIYNKSIFLSDDHVTFKVTPNQKHLNFGVRSEVAVNYPYDVGDVVTYDFDIYIPKKFHADQLKRWMIITQWHDQPKIDSGENWSDFPKNSPPVSLFIESRNGIFGVGIKYGDKEVWKKYEKGRWFKHRFTFLWSNKDDGRLSVSVNGEEFASFQGANMLNDYYHYLKLGIYQHPDINVGNTLSFRGLSIKRKIL